MSGVHARPHVEKVWRKCHERKYFTKCDYRNGRQGAEAPRITEEGETFTSNSHYDGCVYEMVRTMGIDTGKKLRALDLTGGMGGMSSAIAMTRWVEDLRIYDIDSTHCDYIAHNLRVTGCCSDGMKLTVIHGDSSTLPDRLAEGVIDVAVLDAPWGGRDAVAPGASKVSLHLGDRSIGDIIRRMWGKTRLMMFTLPQNIKLQELKDEICREDAWPGGVNIEQVGRHYLGWVAVAKV